MPAAFHLEDDWYLVEDKYSWNIGKLDSTSGRYKSQTYHANVEQALRYYLNYRRAEALHSAAHGTIEDVLDIITSENDRLLCTLLSAFSSAYASQVDLTSTADSTDLTDDDIGDALDEDDEDIDDDLVDDDLDEEDL